MAEQHFGIIVRRPLQFRGQQYNRGDEMPAELEITSARIVQRLVDAGKVRRQLISGTSVAQATGDPAQPQVDLAAAAAAGIGQRTVRKPKGASDAEQAQDPGRDADPADAE